MLTTPCHRHSGTTTMTHHTKQPATSTAQNARIRRAWPLSGAYQGVDSCILPWDPRGNSPFCCVDGLGGRTEQFGNRPEPTPCLSRDGAPPLCLVFRTIVQTRIRYLQIYQYRMFRCIDHSRSERQSKYSSMLRLAMNHHLPMVGAYCAFYVLLLYL